MKYKKEIYLLCEYSSRLMKNMIVIKISSTNKIYVLNLTAKLILDEICRLQNDEDIDEFRIANSILNYYNDSSISQEEVVKDVKDTLEYFIKIKLLVQRG